MNKEFKNLITKTILFKNSEIDECLIEIFLRVSSDVFDDCGNKFTLEYTLTQNEKYPKEFGLTARLLDENNIIDKCECRNKFATLDEAVTLMKTLAANSVSPCMVDDLI